MPKKKVRKKTKSKTLITNKKFRNRIISVVKDLSSGVLSIFKTKSQSHLLLIPSLFGLVM